MITYANKDKFGAPPINEWRDVDANQVKDAINILEGRTTVSVKEYGATGDGVTDDTAAIQAAIDSLDLSTGAGGRGGIVFMPKGKYRTTAPIILNSPAITLQGVGGHIFFYTGEGNTNGSMIWADHFAGPVVVIADHWGGVADLNISASDARKNAEASNNYGILVVKDSESPNSISRPFLSRVNVGRQPSHGIVIAGHTSFANLSQCTVRECLGHGFLITYGYQIGLYNDFVLSPGMSEMRQCEAYDCGGHALVIGDAVNTYTGGVTDRGCYRWDISNFEAVDCLRDYDLRITNHQVHICGNSIKYETGAVRGRRVTNPTELETGGIPNFTGGISHDGQASTYLNCRFIGVTGMMTIGANIRTFDLTAIGAILFIREITDITGLENYKIPIGYDLGDNSEGCFIKTTNTVPRITKVISDSGNNNTHIDTYNGLLSSDVSKYRNISISDDGVYTITYIRDVFNGIFFFYGNSSFVPTGSCAFRAASTSSFISLINATNSGSLEFTTGVLTGTTGTDGKLTISINERTIYIENRLGSDRSFGFTAMRS